MRTTLDIDPDVLQAAKDLAREQRTTAGAVISRLAREALTAPTTPVAAEEPQATYGFRPFPRRGGLVTNDLIDRLREDEID
jgi:hypothetical protein